MKLIFKCPFPATAIVFACAIDVCAGEAIRHFAPRPVAFPFLHFSSVQYQSPTGDHGFVSKLLISDWLNPDFSARTLPEIPCRFRS
jgi:hypothetical protein